ncbi:MAG: EamA family transporter [Chloroflexi bacterium]|nr:EamA family transporter [Chloroflexota bacterium]
MKNWLMFWTLGGIWGASFLLIKVGVEGLGPLPLVSTRIGVAAVIMFFFLLLTKRRWPADRREQAALVFVGLFNTAIPWTLITWGEQEVDSGLATVLNATVPLFTLALAHVALPDEKITPQKAAGLVVGFIGVALLASRSTDSSSPNSISGQLAVLAAAVAYAFSAIALRRYLRKVEPLTIAGGSLIIGAIPMVLITLVAAPRPDPDDLTLQVILAALTLATLNTVIAYFLFYRLIFAWGATRTTLVTYAMPPIGVTLGALFLDETVDWKIVVGAGLILGGIVVVNWRKRRVPPQAVVIPEQAEV